ncbi:MAG: VCBS repeat-containing protein, partial [Phycisphaerales bacterium]|nr:VCBS repeat-containing protein [Phycisphaerales bacterium]
MKTPSLTSLMLLACAAAAHAASPAFTDITAASGINVLQIGAGYPQEGQMMGGMAAADFNRDGWIDLYVVCGGDQRDVLYLNDGTGHFIDASDAWGIGTPAYSSGVAVGDVDADGWIDVYVSTHGTQADGVVIDRHRLYRNVNGVGFVEQAMASGVARTSPLTADGFSAAFGDYDLDGDLDLAVAGWRGQSRGNRLFRNDGTGHFTDVTESAILHNLTPVRGFTPRFSDMDGDRFPELLWVADFETSRYLRNNRDGTFTEMTAAANVGHDQNGMGTAVGDFDNDGDPDWYVSSIYLPAAFKEGNKLYINQGNHLYDEVAMERGVDQGGWGWGVEAIDVDHDGDLDLYSNGTLYQNRTTQGIDFDALTAA